MKVLTFSRHFPTGHPKAGQPTWFVNKIWNCFRRVEDNSLPAQYFQWVKKFPSHSDEYRKAVNADLAPEPKHHTIRAGNRWKSGDMASLRIWSDKPYRSKQIEFAQVEVKKTWEFRILFEPFHKAIFYLNGNELSVRAVVQIAQNDGLTEQDFLDWFKIHPKSKSFEFIGQVISWSSVIDYTPSLTEKAKQ
jgi:hypothetical protein